MSIIELYVILLSGYHCMEKITKCITIFFLLQIMLQRVNFKIASFKFLGKRQPGFFIKWMRIMTIHVSNSVPLKWFIYMNIELLCLTLTEYIYSKFAFVALLQRRNACSSQFLHWQIFKLEYKWNTKCVAYIAITFWSSDF